MKLVKITLILLQSLDGIISTGNDDRLNWGTREDKLFFKKITEEIGFMIMGRTTYKTMPKKVFETRKALVFTRDQSKLAIDDNVNFFTGSVQDVVKFLQASGIKEAALIGGANLINQFWEAGLIDEIYLTIAPVILSKGLASFAGITKSFKMELIETITFSEKETILHYRVFRNS